MDVTFSFVVCSNVLKCRNVVKLELIGGNQFGGVCVCNYYSFVSVDNIIF
jgi:hypothetical protein